MLFPLCVLLSIFAYKNYSAMNLYHGNSYLYGPANLPCVHPDYDIRLPLQYFRGHAYSMSLGLDFYVSDILCS